MTRIAVVGLGGVFPGARTLDEFRNAILAGQDLSSDAPADRWGLDPARVHQPWPPAPDRVYSRRGYFIDRDYKPDLSGLFPNPDDLSRLDPSSVLALDAGRQAWAACRTDSVDPARAGVILGQIALPTDSATALALEVIGKRIADLQPDLSLGAAGNPFSPENRRAVGTPALVLAGALGLGGEAWTLDAACASSLFAVKLACDELLAGRADLMLAGGLSRPDCLYTQMGFSQLRALSPSGFCAPFDARGDGLLVGEGAGVVVLKRLEDALTHQDRIWGLIRGWGLANDLEGGLLAPAEEGQIRAMTSAYRRAGLSPWEVELIECHATGTPLGDRVEIQSLKALWTDAPRRPEKCVLSSVKSTVGHLLTGAGAAGLIKTLLAMDEGLLPPTANFEKAPDDMGLAESPFEVTSQARLWEKTSGPKRAGVSGFGFGGADAHLVVEEWDGRDDRVRVFTPAAKDDGPVAAVVGLAASLGPWPDLETLSGPWFFETGHKPPSERRGWWGLGRTLPPGWYLDEVRLPIGRFRIPPRESADMLPQQALMLNIAADALADAGYAPDPTRTAGAVIGLTLDQNTTNYHLRWSLEEKARRLLEQKGPSPDSQPGQAYLESLKEAVGPPLTADRVLGALGSITAGRIAREFKMGGPSFTVSSHGAMGLVPVRAGLRALQTNDLDLVLVGAVDFGGDVRDLSSGNHGRPPVPIAEGAAALVLKRIEDAQRDGDHIYATITAPERDPSGEPGPDYVEIFGPEEPGKHQSGGEGLCGLVQNETGFAGAAAGLVSVVRTALALAERRLPAASFSIDSEQTRPGYWLKNRADGLRTALVQGPGQDGLVMKEPPERTLEVVFNHRPGEALFIASGEDEKDLLAELAELDRIASSASDRSISRLQHLWEKRGRRKGPAERTLALIADDFERLIGLVAQAGSELEAGAESLTGPRLFFESRPLGQVGEIAFVFPGSGSHFPGLGFDLAQAWPEIFDRQDAGNELLKDQFAADHFWYGRRREIDHRDLIGAQVAVGTVVFDILTEAGLKPQALIGHSLGETAALFACRAWPDRDEMQRRLTASTLFTRDLCGECRAAARLWGRPEDEPVVWLSGTVLCPADKIRPLLEEFPRVFLQTINAPDECTIGGEEASVRALVERLGRPFLPASGVSAVHCDVVGPVRDAYRELHLFETRPPEDIRVYSAAWGRAYRPERESAADSITDQASGAMDFPRLVERAYQDGVRLFLEIGPGGSCTRMISRILEGRPFAARPAYLSGRDPRLTIAQALAWAAAHGVAFKPSDLGEEPPEAIIPPQPEKKKEIIIQTGRDALLLPPPPRSPEPEPRAKPSRLCPERSRTTDQAAILEAQIRDLTRTQEAGLRAHEAFLKFTEGINRTLAEALQFQSRLTGHPSAFGGIPPEKDHQDQKREDIGVFMNRDQCLEFAVGRIGRVLGPDFDPVDGFPTRVRLPDEPLMLVDRIMTVEGEPLSLTPGRVVTEHDVLRDGWYLDNGRIPTCIAIEAGQADLFLSGYLGIDFETRGLAMYRLLDAEVTFMGPLPRPGQVINYDIRIDRFFRHGRTHLFRFRFEASVEGRLLMVMQNGCAGFFTQAELDSGQGLTSADLNPKVERKYRPKDWIDLAPPKTTRLDERQIQSLYDGDLAGCFGVDFEGLKLKGPLTLPGDKLELIDRVLDLDPYGGRYGLGSIKTEMDIHPDDWFLTCHFVDDMVMPGTLMYECCLHSLRIHLLSLGWIGEKDETVCEPLAGVTSKLKCRGQVVPTTKKAAFEIFIKELGFEPAPYAVADGIMYADERPVVGVEDMTVQLTGLTRDKLLDLWSHRPRPRSTSPDKEYFSREQILAFAQGKPSDAFGEPYRVFDEGRFVARLPRPPYSFMDRVRWVRGAEPFEIRPGAEAEAEYHPPDDAWYFRDNQGIMPFSILLETALQPCGWLAAYSGAALQSRADLHFRNLGGTAEQKAIVRPGGGPLVTRVKLTKASRSGDMFIQHYDFRVTENNDLVYEGSTYFGFFTRESLANQQGLPEAPGYHAGSKDSGFTPGSFPDGAGFPGGMIRMMDEIVDISLDGGPAGLGAILGRKRVDPEDWFFTAHFFQDPVWPGSLGLEAMLQLLQVLAADRWGRPPDGGFEACVPGVPHEWVYRGQVVPQNKEVLVNAFATEIDDDKKVLTGAGFLTVDGLTIYRMKGFSIKLSSNL